MGRIPLFPPSELLHGNNRIKGDSTGLRSPWFLPILCRIICVFLVTNYENHSTFHRTFVRRFAGDIFHFTIGRCSIFESGFQTPVHRAAGARAGWSFVYLDPKAASIIAIMTTAKPTDNPSGNFKVKDLNAKVAAVLGASVDQVRIINLAVDTSSKLAYLSVIRGRDPTPTWLLYPSELVERRRLPSGDWNRAGISCW